MGRQAAAIRLGRLVEQMRGTVPQDTLFDFIIVALVTYHPAFYTTHRKKWPRHGRQWIGRLESGEIANIVHHAEFIDALGRALRCTPEQQQALYEAVGIDPFTTFDPLERRAMSLVRDAERTLIAEFLHKIRRNLSNCPTLDVTDAMLGEWFRDALVLWAKRFRP